MRYLKKYTLLAFASLGLFNACEEKEEPPTKLKATVSVQDASGFNETDGQIDINVSEGEGPFRFFGAMAPGQKT
ncbi:MAG: hypothetical protein HC842_06425 [Cytophagales bacterium]|nr:hypothetical protein [Cytophagales bacterium]